MRVLCSTGRGSRHMHVHALFKSGWLQRLVLAAVAIAQTRAARNWCYDEPYSADGCQTDCDYITSCEHECRWDTFYKTWEKCNLVGKRCLCDVPAFNPACDAPIDLVFVIDESGSTENDYEGTAMYLAQRRFVKQMADQFALAANKGRISIVGFSSMWSARLIQGLTSDRSKVRDAIGQTKHTGTTYLKGGLALAYTQLRDASSKSTTTYLEKKVVLVLLDGKPHDYNQYARDVANLQSLATVIAVGYSGGAHQASLEAIASKPSKDYTFSHYKLSDTLNQLKGNRFCVLSKKTRAPTKRPTRIPTRLPTLRPTRTPTRHPTLYPTQIPTPSPTPAPTFHPCDDGSHGCDTGGGACVRDSSVSPPWRCVCSAGYYCTAGCAGVHSGHTCTLSKAPTALPSALPTPSPSVVPTAMPSATPTHAPTNQPSATPTEAPTKHPCDDGTHGCDEFEHGTCNKEPGRTPPWSCGCSPGYYCAAGCSNADKGHAVHCNKTQILVATPLQPFENVNMFPTLVPTPEPMRHPCEDGSHGCDAAPGGLCMSLVDDIGPGSNKYSCYCDNKRGYSCVSGCDGSIFSDKAPANFKCARSATPTSAPTLHPCVDGSNVCNHDGGRCYSTNTAAGWRCGCKPFHRCMANCNDDNQPHWCLPTSIAPTASPQEPHTIRVTFPGDISALSAIERTAFASQVKQGIAASSGLLTEADIEKVTLAAGSIVATATFAPEVSRNAVETAVTALNAKKLVVTIGAQSFTAQTSASEQQPPSNDGDGEASTLDTSLTSNVDDLPSKGTSKSQDAADGEAASLFGLPEIGSVKLTDGEILVAGGTLVLVLVVCAVVLLCRSLPKPKPGRTYSTTTDFNMDGEAADDDDDEGYGFGTGQDASKYMMRFEKEAKGLGSIRPGGLFTSDRSRQSRVASASIDFDETSSSFDLGAELVPRPDLPARPDELDTDQDENGPDEQGRLQLVGRDSADVRIRGGEQ